ncbi:hypothetical protein LP090_10495 [Moraxella bovis]|uniref:hypothetical protein n=1 Tax=Moraxella bovis TaxID=476 RepID=UPI002226434B|nr:hypothetical protein [Moraxella bovis]UYZ68981.1 hypothetical protein LP122_02490 [Moraxella bovis]UYZ71355.1 hypothetical protein LP089_02545 [Moraxella bovis]UYZ72732.1 hypothetical protein LP105_10115 [Moraxella bovis]UZA14648.1 hypothetical protein LP102_02480 [Moraxella bovis]UZA26989.1 hypothetical protein LP119_10355 [Moraxella bovis]
MAKIHFFQAGYCTHPACVAVRGAGFGACEFPARVFLLEANGRFWLWDTGYAEHFLPVGACMPCTPKSRLCFLIRPNTFAINYKNLA